MPRGRPNGPQQPYNYEIIESESHETSIKQQIDDLMVRLQLDMQDVPIRSEATGLARECAKAVVQVFDGAVDRNKPSRVPSAALLKKDVE
ncbi:hypothetical protein QFC20_001376 [Naganishia adeliensis]|uniref:Uncharacterized protein n=1 Tax=Naganishia adeliensis TaxID=92952 RepID=A0ACC2WRV2_9TREE|nr:hypothetical protein QFC20_001376 [Naganishia adeliensis]